MTKTVNWQLSKRDVIETKKSQTLDVIGNLLTEVFPHTDKLLLNVKYPYSMVCDDTSNFEFDEYVFSQSITNDWQCESHYSSYHASALSGVSPFICYLNQEVQLYYNKRHWVNKNIKPQVWYKQFGRKSWEYEIWNYIFTILYNCFIKY